MPLTAAAAEAPDLLPHALGSARNASAVADGGA
jgi:hypothetical protein